MYPLRPRVGTAYINLAGKQAWLARGENGNAELGEAANATHEAVIQGDAARDDEGSITSEELARWLAAIRNNYLPQPRMKKLMAQTKLPTPNAMVRAPHAHHRERFGWPISMWELMP